MMETMSKTLTNFWVALSLAILALFGAFISYLAKDTGWAIADMVFAVYWLFVSWVNSQRKEQQKGETNE